MHSLYPRRWRKPLSSCAVSCLFHLALLTALALVVDAARSGTATGTLDVAWTSPAEVDAALDADPLTFAALDKTPATASAASPDPSVDVALPPDKAVKPEKRPVARAGKPFSQAADWLTPTGAFVGGGGLEGRTAAGRAKMVGDRGGSRQSEEAVERGLWWLVAHQLDDGSWNFDHRKSPCGGLCRNPGDATSTTAATAVALLAFLGAGCTQSDGQHQETVRRGFYYLMRRGLVTPRGLDLQEGTMYGQGLAAVALAEDYAMTRDPAIKDVAQQATEFILVAQDRRGGGWRYSPGQPGDTTVTGWQLMALKSAHSAGLDVPSPATFLAANFLDSVQSEEGARYGYMPTDPRNSHATTAVGLLCRMFTGWRRDHSGLAKGVQYLAKWGPSETDIYYDYYATQVLFHWEGSDWIRWNMKMRDLLVATQATEGHESGSWYFDCPRYRDAGGRLFSTALAIMTLEVYYRYMPLYSGVRLD